jgi:hypothetical protein
VPKGGDKITSMVEFELAFCPRKFAERSLRYSPIGFGAGHVRRAKAERAEAESPAEKGDPGKPGKRAVR